VAVGKPVPPPVAVGEGTERVDGDNTAGVGVSAAPQAPNNHPPASAPTPAVVRRINSLRVKFVIVTQLLSGSETSAKPNQLYPKRIDMVSNKCHRYLGQMTLRLRQRKRPLFL
jgi:hypothetical protein